MKALRAFLTTVGMLATLSIAHARSPDVVTPHGSNGWCQGTLEETIDMGQGQFLKLYSPARDSTKVRVDCLINQRDTLHVLDECAMNQPCEVVGNMDVCSRELADLLFNGNCVIITKVTTVQKSPTGDMAKVFAQNPADNPDAIFTLVNKPPILDTKEKVEYRTRIKEIAKDPVNFAGHYAVGSFGCGTECSVWVIIDARNGKVLPFIPVFVGDLPTEEVSKPDFSFARFSLGSRVIVFDGQLNETGPSGLHYFVIENGSLKPIEK
jgi:hypothetical protein